MMSRFVFLQFFILGFNSINIISASEIPETDPVLSLASQLYDEGEYSKAVSELTNAIDSNPKPEYYVRRGEYYRKMYDVPATTSTVQDFRTAQIMRENPNTPPLDVARSLRKQGKYTDAIVFYDQAVNADSTGENFQERGDCYRDMGDTSAAIANYQIAQRKMTNYTVVLPKPTED